MAADQLNYAERSAALGSAGSYPDSQPRRVLSRNVEDADLQFGRAVKIGSTATRVKPYRQDDQTNLTAYFGVSVKSRVQPGAANYYPRYETAAIMQEGTIVVLADGAVTVGADVSINADDGRFGTKAAVARANSPGANNYAPAQVALPGARFLTAADDGEPAVLYVDGRIMHAATA